MTACSVYQADYFLFCFQSLDSRLKEYDLTTMGPVDSFFEILANKAFTKSSYVLDQGLQVSQHPKLY